LGAIAFTIATSAGTPHLVSTVTVLASSLVFQFGDSFDFWFQSKTQAQFVSIPRTLAFLCGAVGKIVCLVLHAPVTWYAGVSVVEAGITAAFLGGVFFTKSRPSPPALAFSLQTAAHLFRLCWPMFLSTVFVAMYMRVDQFMLKQFLGIDAV